MSIRLELNLSEMFDKLKHDAKQTGKTQMARQNLLHDYLNFPSTQYEIMRKLHDGVKNVFPVEEAKTVATPKPEVKAEPEVETKPEPKKNVLLEVAKDIAKGKPAAKGKTTAKGK